MDVRHVAGYIWTKIRVFREVWIFDFRDSRVDRAVETHKHTDRRIDRMVVILNCSTRYLFNCLSDFGQIFVR